MSLTNQQYEAVFRLYPQIVTMNGADAVDANGNEVAYDMDAVNAEVENIQAELQAKEINKQNAIAKLAAIGLTAEEIAALGVN